VAVQALSFLDGELAFRDATDPGMQIGLGQRYRADHPTAVPIRSGAATSPESATGTGRDRPLDEPCRHPSRHAPDRSPESYWFESVDEKTVMHARKSKLLTLTLAAVVVASAASAGVGSVVAQTTPTVSVDDGTVGVGASTTVDVTADDLPNGLQTYNLTVTVSNGSVADVGAVRDGDVGGIQVRSRTDDSVTFRAADLGFAVGPGASDVVLATVELNGTAAGQADLRVTVNEFTDDDGTDVAPATTDGTLTVTTDDDGTDDDGTDDDGTDDDGTDDDGTTGGATTVAAGDETVAPGDVGSVDVTADDLPDGLQVYNVTVSLSNGSVADVGAVRDGDVGGLQVRSRTDDSVTIRAADLGLAVGPGASDVVLATVELNDTAAGSTAVEVDVHEIVDDDGNSFDPSERDGSLTVESGGGVTGAVQYADGTAASDGAVGFDDGGDVTFAGTGTDGSYSASVPAGSYDRVFVQTGPPVENGAPVLPDDGRPDIAALDAATVSAGEDLGTDTLPAAHDLTVTVVDEDGNPVNATVGVYPRDGSGGSDLGYGWVQAVGDDGEFQAHPGSTGIEVGGRVTVRVDAPAGYATANDTAERDVEVTGDRDLRFELERPPTTTVNVTLDGAPDGLQAFNVTVAADTGAPVTDVEDGVLSLSVTSGGVGEPSVSVASADVGRQIGPTDETLRLASITFAGDLNRSDVSLTVRGLTDDDGDAMNTSRVGLALGGSEEVFTDPIVGGGATPTDPDGDDLYEDVDGDGEATFGDAVDLGVVAALGPAGDELTAEQEAALDFDGDGEFTFQDSIDLGVQVSLG
jgi:hypothetical protein